MPKVPSRRGERLSARHPPAARKHFVSPLKEPATSPIFRPSPNSPGVPSRHQRQPVSAPAPSAEEIDVFHGVRCLSMALRITNSLRIHALSATFGDLNVTEQPLIEGAECGAIAAARQGSHREHIPWTYREGVRTIIRHLVRMFEEAGCASTEVGWSVQERRCTDVT